MSSQLIEQAILPSSSAKWQSCPGCGRSLPIRAPRRNEEIARWVCESCGGTMNGLLLPDLAPKFGDRLRLAPEHFDARLSEPIPASLRGLVEKFLILRRAKQEFHERRRNPRVPCDLDAVVVGLDAEWLPCRRPMNAVVVDLAVHGLGMMTAQCVHDERLAIQISCPAGLVQLLGRRAWSNYVGDSFQNTGVEFMARLGHTILDDGLIG
jgi:hypothetical protein